MKFAEQKKEELRLTSAVAREAEKSLAKGLTREQVYTSIGGVLSEYAVPVQEG